MFVSESVPFNGKRVLYLCLKTLNATKCVCQTVQDSDLGSSSNPPHLSQIKDDKAASIAIFVSESVFSLGKGDLPFAYVSEYN